MAVPQPEVNDHGDAHHWSSCDHPIYKTVVLFPQNAPLTCFLMFDDQTAATPTFRNELLSPEDGGCTHPECSTILHTPSCLTTPTLIDCQLTHLVILLILVHQYLAPSPN